VRQHQHPNPDGGGKDRRNDAVNAQAADCFYLSPLFAGRGLG
jgi:hypothetical protein